MQFNKLRLLGFKSFVEPTEFAIERGLTGVVGPNGCGKSNLVEALRWVMGENSYKNMRASSMDDVIFSGSGNRPSRNMAEVALFLDNDDRTAPAAFNDSDELQVSRRIEREAGSVYRINGRDVRAKDVQLLFADVSTGARSPSMIGQGRIGELISAKPQARRALLEEAAGISGLHSRRHEAELRLRAAETNLERLDDVVVALEAQLDSLKRQARQANRFRTLAGEIRRAEAGLFYLRWAAASRGVREASATLQDATVSIAEAGITQGEAAKAQAIAAAKLPELRHAESSAAAALQHKTIQREQAQDEAKRIKRRIGDIQGRIEQLEADIAREERMVAENSDIIGHLDREEAQLRAEEDTRAERETDLAAAVETATARLQEAEAAGADMTAALATARANRETVLRRLQDAERRRDQLAVRRDETQAALSDVQTRLAATSEVETHRETVAELEARSATQETALAELEGRAMVAQDALSAAREPAAHARQVLAQIQTEAQTLKSIVDRHKGDLFAPVVDAMRVDKGYEQALGAALGEDLDVPLDRSSAEHWTLNLSESDASLPENVEPLSGRVEAPRELHRRLAQIGIVDRESGDRLQQHLASGQCLVSLSGDLWRWDGYRAGSDAKTAAAVKLEQKNRIAELSSAAIEAEAALASAEAGLDAARSLADTTRNAEQAARTNLKETQRDLSQKKRALDDAERAVADLTTRQAALQNSDERVSQDVAEAEAAVDAAKQESESLPDLAGLEDNEQAARQRIATDRSAFTEARTTYDSLTRENALRQERLGAIGRERKTWNDRAVNADRHIGTLRERQQKARDDLEKLVERPDDLQQRQAGLQREIEAAEQMRRKAADTLARGETVLRQADQAASAALNTLSDAKQNGARAEERLEAAQERLDEIAARIREDLSVEPHVTLALSGADKEADLPNRESLEAKLERFRAERERLGAVNLRAEIEQTEIAEQRDTLVMERDDLTEAIRQLRNGIQGLNKEGRERLLVAFDAVNAQFQTLFAHLFGGGTAELQLVESDDPLEAGLEILARPPGKKPQTMTLLSGGEQALTCDGAHLRRVPHQPRTHLCAGRSRRASRRPQCRTVLQPDGPHVRRHRYALRYHNPQPHHDGPHGSPFRGHNGRTGG